MGKGCEQITGGKSRWHKHVKRCVNSVAIRDNQAEIKMRYHFIHSRVTKTKTKQNKHSERWIIAGGIEKEENGTPDAVMVGT